MGFRVLVTAGVVALAAAHAAAAAPAQTQWFHVGGAAFAVCGKVVVVQGDYLVVMRSGSDRANGVHNSFTSSFHGTAIDDAGAEYRYSSTSIQTFNSQTPIPPTGAWEVTVMGSTRFVGKGGAETLEFRTFFHFTTNAKGELTTTVVRSEASCSPPPVPILP